MTVKIEMLLEKMLKNMAIELEPEKKKKLTHYTKLLWDGLNKARITGEKSIEEIVNKQIYDSIYPLKLDLRLDGARVLDLGTGGGLPGVPLKICVPEAELVLMDANKRKVSFLNMAILELNLNGVQILHGRAEKYGRDPEWREKFDLVLAKAVTEAPALVELTLPLARLNGKVLLYKGPQGEDELSAANKALQLCGGKQQNTWDYELPTGEKRKLILLEKTEYTPEAYPRREGRPEKRPLI